MRKIVTRLAVGSLLLLIGLTPLGPATGQPPPQMHEACLRLAFSTEEDFVRDKTIISDGDLLTVYEDGSGNTQCLVCATNADLVYETFDVPYDLGLDAADVVFDAETSVVSFSTELNAPDPARFTHGDLLATNGVIIPNQSLTYRFQVDHDLGLDGLHFVGDSDAILAFLSAAAQFSREDWLRTPDLLVSMLEDHGIDIWFSTEGTLGPVDAPTFLDGDLLSALSGIIVAENSLLLDPSVPAGIPDRGVDFGLDAATGTRTLDRAYVRFSSEILFDGEVSFTDGDVLLAGDGVAVPHGDLIGCFEPAADFLGLDALYMAVEVPQGEVRGRKFHDQNANGVADDGEPGLEQWEIHLDGVDGLEAEALDAAFTDTTGAYTFTVPLGTYKISEVCPPSDPAWHQSLPAPVGEVCGSGVYTITLEASDPLRDGIDFGNYQRGQVTGRKFHDETPDGVWDPSELPLAQWEVHLDGADGMSNPVSLVAYTNEAGAYSFIVPPGGYTVWEVCGDGWAQTVPEPSGACGSGVYTIQTVSAQILEDVDFGNYQPMDMYLPLIVKDY